MDSIEETRHWVDGFTKVANSAGITDPQEVQRLMLVARRQKLASQHPEEYAAGRQEVIDKEAGEVWDRVSQFGADSWDRASEFGTDIWARIRAAWAAFMKRRKESQQVDTDRIMPGTPVKPNKLTPKTPQQYDAGRNVPTVGTNEPYYNARQYVRNPDMPSRWYPEPGKRRSAWTGVEPIKPYAGIAPNEALRAPGGIRGL